MFCVSLVSCCVSCEKPIPQYIGVVVGNTPNSPSVADIFYPCKETSPGSEDNCTDTEVSNDLMNKLNGISAKCDKGVISADSLEFTSVNPSLIDSLNSGSDIKLKCDAKTGKRKITQTEQNKKELRGAFSELNTPTYNGADYFGAVNHMADGFLEKVKSYLESSKKKQISFSADIFVLGSGLSDSGLLNFAVSNYLYKGSAQSIAKKFLEMHPSLRNPDYYQNITLHFAGLGNVVKPQPLLDETEKQSEKIKDIYENIFKGLGYKVVIDPASASIADYENVIQTDYRVNVTPIGGCDPVSLIYGEDKIKFKGNSYSAFDDATPSSKVKSIIKEIANTYRDSKIVVEGYEAQLTPERVEKSDLTQSRADVIRGIFTEDFKFNSSRITAVGKGTGPYEQQSFTDEKELSKNRIIKIKIQSNECNSK